MGCANLTTDAADRCPPHRRGRPGSPERLNETRPRFLNREICSTSLLQSDQPLPTQGWVGRGSSVLPEKQQHYWHWHIRGGRKNSCRTRGEHHRKHTAKSLSLRTRGLECYPRIEEWGRQLNRHRGLSLCFRVLLNLHSFRSQPLRPAWPPPATSLQPEPRA